MKSLTISRKFLAISLSLCLILPSTAFGKDGKKNFREGMKYVATQQWDLAAREFALAVAAEPDNAEYRAHYVRALMQASIMFVKRGDTLAEQQDYPSAYNAYRLAYSYDPSNELAQVKMQRMLEMQKAQAGLIEMPKYNPHTGAILPASGDVRVASRPRFGEIQKKIEIKDLSLKSSVANIGKTLGLNVIFDETVRDARFSIDLQDVSFARAFDLVLLQNKLVFELVDRRTLFVYPDNQTNRSKFERMVLKTFYVSNVKLTEVRTAIQTLFTGSAPGRLVQSVDSLNALIVRANPAEMQVVQELLNSLDKNPAEVVVDVNIYEIGRTDALTIGNQIATSSGKFSRTTYDYFEVKDKDGKVINTIPIPKSVTTIDGSSTASLGNLGGIGQLGTMLGYTYSPFLGGIGTMFGLPPTTLSLLQTRDRSRLLHSSQVHALDGQQNQTKVGESVPVRTGTNYVSGVVTTGGTGGTVAPTAFDSIQYRDVGLTIDVTPKITNEGYVELKMKLESNSVEDSSTLTPRFTQRSITTVARVLDGVTAVVAGVKQDDRVNNRSTIPIIGMVPILGRFFTTPTQSKRETDLVVTVTPHIVRAPQINPEDHLAQQSGAMQGGVMRSLEEVLQIIQAEEEQERRLIAKQSPQSAPTTPVSNSADNIQTSGPAMIAANASVNTVSSAAVPAAPPNPYPTPQIQETSNVQQPLRPGLERRFPYFAGGPPSNQAVQDPARQAELVRVEGGTGEIQAEVKREGEFNEGEYAQKPTEPVRPAKIVAAQMPERVRKAIEEMEKEKKAESALPTAKSPKSGMQIEVPPEVRRMESSPQQPISRATVKPGRHAEEATPITVSLTPQTTPQANKKLLVAVTATGKGMLTGAILNFKFDPSKLRVQAVRPGTLLSDKNNVTYQVTNGDLQITIKDVGQKALSDTSNLAIIELMPLEASETQIELQTDRTQLSLAGDLKVQLSALPAKLRITK